MSWRENYSIDEAFFISYSCLKMSEKIEWGSEKAPSQEPSTCTLYFLVLKIIAQIGTIANIK